MRGEGRDARAVARGVRCSGHDVWVVARRVRGAAREVRAMARWARGRGSRCVGRGLKSTSTIGSVATPRRGRQRDGHSRSWSRSDRRSVDVDFSPRPPAWLGAAATDAHGRISGLGAAGDVRGRHGLLAGHRNGCRWHLARLRRHPGRGVPLGGSRSDLEPARAGEPVAGVEVVAPSPRYAEDGIVFAGAFDGLFRWREGGTAWEHLLTGSRVLSLAVTPGDPSAPADGSGLMVLAGTETDGVLVSRDGGRTWGGRQRRPARPGGAGPGRVADLRRRRACVRGDPDRRLSPATAPNPGGSWIFRRRRWRTSGPSVSRCRPTSRRMAWC